ncbi:hypothetical protein [Sorangium sp. So ce124]|uniref:RHS repeat domain-containing protein n=1 Tax=Sorangium sp. So ce124 TaxID=3133280 RepID=UPI003F63162E
MQLDQERGEWLALGTFTCDRRGDLVAATDADGHAWRYAYEEGHLLVEDADRDGLTWHFVYDSHHRGVEAWGDYGVQADPSLAGERSKYLYDQETRWKGLHHCKVNYWDIGFTEVIDFSQSRRFHGNEHGTLDKQVIGGAVVAATYREDGWMTSRRNERQGLELFERNARGSVVRYVDPLRYVTRIERDANDLPVEIVDAAGGMHRFERDARGNVTLYVDPTGAATSRRYDARGLVVEEISPDGERTAFSYDAHGNCAEVTLASGATWRFRHDRLGRRAAEIDPFGAETRYRWSARGDLAAVIDPTGATTRYAYDGEQHVTQIVDANGGVTSLVWGGYHKLCARRDANGHEVRLGYNPEGELIEVRNENGEVHTLRRDGSGKVLEEVTFDWRTIHCNHDPAGDLIRRSQDELDRVRLGYDLAGRIIRREYWDGSAECLEYDELGALIGVTWPGGEIRLDRDAAGRVVREIQIVDGVEHRVESAYDREGERVLRETSLGHSEAVERGPCGARRRTVLDGRVVVDHASDVHGREVARALPGGGRIESAYDRMGRLERRRAVGPSREVRVRPGEPAWVGPRPENVTVDMAYRYDGSAPVAHRDDGRWFHSVNDPIGTPERLVYERGEVACELRRDAWGRTEAAPEARTSTALRFPGQYEDPEKVLCYEDEIFLSIRSRAGRRDGLMARLGGRARGRRQAVVLPWRGQEGPLCRARGRALRRAGGRCRAGAARSFRGRAPQMRLRGRVPSLLGGARGHGVRDRHASSVWWDCHG